MSVHLLRRYGVHIVMFGLLSNIAWAGDEPSGELTLPQAIAVTLARNPALAVSAYELQAAEARRVQAAVRINPELSVELENFAGSGATRGIKALETTLSLSRTIELGGKRQRRVEVSSVDRELIGIERQSQQLDVLGEVTRKFIDVVEAQELLALARRATELAQSTLDISAHRVAAARSPEAERSRARIALTRAQIEQQQADSRLLGARRELAALWGSEQPLFTMARADLYRLTPIESFESLQNRLRGNPDFLRLASATRLRDAELRLQQAQARPNLNVALGVRRFEDTGNGALVASVAIPLRFYDQNQGAIREAEVRRAQSQAQLQAATLRAQATLFSLYQQLQSTGIRVTTLREQALPQAQAALEQTQYAYERGRFSQLELIAAQQELLALYGATITAAADYHRLLAEVERLTSEPLAVAE